MVERKKTLELKKHVAAIHSSNKLSLLQRKIANALLFNAYDELLEKDEYSIHVATLCNLIGYDSNDYKTIKKSLVNLLATVIEWNLVDGDKLNSEGVWNASSIIADASIDGPLCTYSYSNKMKNLLHRPELYGRLNMLVQAKFQSSYGLALYENCIRFQGIDQTPSFDIQKFRKLMGVEEGKYRIFRDFKNRVIDKAVEEVNKYSPIIVTPKYKKQGRQVVAIQFMIEHTNHHDISTSLQSNLSEILKLKFGFSKKQIQEVMSTYDEKYIGEKITIIESSASYINGKISNLAKYLLSALQDDYQPIKSTKKPTKIVLGKNLENIKQERLKQDTREEYRRYQYKQILKLFEEQSAKLKKSILAEFEKHLGKGIYFDIYLRDRLENILIRDQLCLFVLQKRYEFVENIASQDQFLSVNV